ncbi:MAG: hypothetical protein P4M13_06510 [Alphaproteobacteria bacterium]|nr:hypothetical protein [Alphaproteobacteria bacterium]
MQGIETAISGIDKGLVAGGAAVGEEEKAKVDAMAEDVGSSKWFLNALFYLEEARKYYGDDTPEARAAARAETVHMLALKDFVFIDKKTGEKVKLSPWEREKIQNNGRRQYKEGGRTQNGEDVFHQAEQIKHRKFSNLKEYKNREYYFNRLVVKVAPGSRTKNREESKKGLALADLLEGGISKPKVAPSYPLPKGKGIGTGRPAPICPP